MRESEKNVKQIEKFMCKKYLLAGRHKMYLLTFEQKILKRGERVTHDVRLSQKENITKASR